MKHVKKFESFRIKKNRDEIIKESVLQVNDLYKVKTMIDIPQSLINQYVKKVKDTTGKDLRKFFGDVDIAEEIIKYVTTNFINVDKIPGGAVMGGQTQAQAQGAQEGGQAQVQVETQPQGQVQPQGQAQVQGQTQPDDFEEPQIQGQPQGQGQVQVQTEPQIQGQGQNEEDEEENEELPL